MPAHGKYLKKPPPCTSTDTPLYYDTDRYKTYQKVGVGIVKRLKKTTIPEIHKRMELAGITPIRGWTFSILETSRNIEMTEKYPFDEYEYITPRENPKVEYDRSPGAKSDPVTAWGAMRTK